METPKGDLTKINKKEVKIKKYIDSLKQLKDKLKQYIKNEGILNSFAKNNNDNKIYLNFFFFENLKKFVKFDIIDNSKKNIIYKYLSNSKEYTDNINNLYEIIIEWIYYLYFKLIDNIYYTELIIISKEINQINFLLDLTFDIIIKLYNNSNNFFSTNDIFDVLYFLLFLIENNLNVNYDSGFFDKLYYIKNYALLKNLFSFYGKVSYIILNKANINENEYENTEEIDENYKKEISLFFQYLKDLEGSKEVNYILNKSIIFNNNFLDDLFAKKIWQ